MLWSLFLSSWAPLNWLFPEASEEASYSILVKLSLFWLIFVRLEDNATPVDIIVIDMNQNKWSLIGQRLTRHPKRTEKEKAPLIGVQLTPSPCFISFINHENGRPHMLIVNLYIRMSIYVLFSPRKIISYRYYKFWEKICI